MTTLLSRRSLAEARKHDAMQKLIWPPHFIKEGDAEPRMHQFFSDKEVMATLRKKRKR
jgi:hypothetical protein